MTRPDPAEEKDGALRDALQTVGERGARPLQRGEPFPLTVHGAVQVREEGANTLQLMARIRAFRGRPNDREVHDVVATPEHARTEGILEARWPKLMPS